MEDLPADILDTWDKLGIPEAEKKYLAGVGAQYESEVVYHKLQADLEAQGVLFLDMDSGLREHEEIVKQYFGTIIPQNDNKFAALNSAVWSGALHLCAAGRADRAPAPGLPDQRREHGPVRADADHRRRGRLRALRRGLHGADLLLRLAPLGRRRDRRQAARPLSLHDNPELVEQRLQSRHQAPSPTRTPTMEWVDGNLGSKLTMKYPAIWLMGPRAHGEVLSIAFAGKGQHQDAGGKVVHVAPKTTSVITSKSISKNGGRAATAGCSRWRRAPPAPSRRSSATR